MNFPKFWYESNACWGSVESMQDLTEKARRQLAENNCIRNIDEFLDKSMKTKGEHLDFGTRREHTSDYSLRKFLDENGILSEFLEYFNSIPA